MIESSVKILGVRLVKIENQKFDVLIAGGGYVGLSLALALKISDPEITVCVVDKRSRSDIEKDGRASAVAASAARMLDSLGIWSELIDHSQPIVDMIVTDSKLRDAVRPVLLKFEGAIEDGKPFAYMVPNSKMVSFLYQKAEKYGIEILTEVSVESFCTNDFEVEASLEGNIKFVTNLLIAADGVKSKLRSLAGIKTVQWDYGQAAIVTTIGHERSHEGRAIEHFLPSGPFAMLPLKGNRSSLVWTESTEDAKKLVHGDDFTFEIELVRRIGHHLGELTVEGPRLAFPLGLTLVRDFVKNRFALVGDAAHGIHPIAGQGLNLGFRDVAALAEVVIDARRLGQDIGMINVLEKYQQWRRFDTWQMGVTTDVLNRLFSNDNDVIRMVRDIGLGLVDRLPPLKQYFIGEAAGKDSGAPKLMVGESI